MGSNKKKVRVFKLPKAQQGMESGQPQAPQGQPQQGGGNMEQLVQQVKQMLDQGGNPQQVIGQLLQGGVPPEAVAQVMTSVGMPQEKVVPLIEQTMQQMQGGQEQAPQQQSGQPQMQEGGEQGMEQMVQQVTKALEGGAKPQQVVAQLLQSVGDSQAVVQLMSAATGGSPEEIGPMVQQVAHQMQYQGQQGSPQPQGQPQMKNGGDQWRNAWGPINPTKDDFMQLKKKVVKEMKAGGESPTFDNSDTASYIQNLQGAIANHVSKNLRIGLVEQQFDKAIKQFEDIPKAQDGLETKLNAYGYTKEDYNNDPAIRKEVDNTFTSSQGMSSDRLSEPEPLQVSQESAVSETQNSNNEETIGEKRARHYYKGTGPGQESLGGRYFDERFDKTPLANLFNSVSKQGTGEYDITGSGELEGASQQEIAARMNEIMKDPSKYNMQMTRGYVNRRGKLKNRPGLFGNRPEAFQFDYAGGVGESDENDLANQGVTRKRNGELDFSNYTSPNPSGGNTANKSNELIDTSQFDDQIEPALRDQMMREKAQADHLLKGKTEGNVTRRPYVPTSETEEEAKARREEQAKLNGYDFSHGGTVPYSAPGKLGVNFDQINPHLAKALNGMQVNQDNYGQQPKVVGDDQSGFRLNEQQERTVDYGQAGQSLYDMGAWFADKAQAVKDVTPTWEATENRQGMVPVYDPNSGSVGNYNQRGEWRGDASGQQGAGVRAGTGSDPDAFIQPGNPNFTGDFMSGQQPRMGAYKMGDEVDLSEDEIRELESFGYKLKRI